MELRHLRYFQAVAETGGFGKAARLLHVAQSAISEQIRDLEQEIGIALIDRSHRLIRLTPDGEVFLEGAKDTLQAAERAVQRVQRAQKGEFGKLSIGFFVGGTGSFFPALIREFRRRYRDVKVSLVELTPFAQMSALQSGEIDIGFTRPIPPPFLREIKSERFSTEQLYAVLPRDHRLAKDKEITISDLQNDRFVMTDRRISMLVFERTMALCAEAGFSPRIAATASVSSGVITLVEAGEGVAILPQGSQMLGTKGVVFRPLSGAGTSIDLVLAWSTEHERAVHRSFLQLARSFRDPANGGRRA